jgi:hypothetical protein
VNARKKRREKKVNSILFRSQFCPSTWWGEICPDIHEEPQRTQWGARPILDKGVGMNTANPPRSDQGLQDSRQAKKLASSAAGKTVVIKTNLPAPIDLLRNRYAREHGGAAKGPVCDEARRHLPGQVSPPL